MVWPPHWLSMPRTSSPLRLSIRAWRSTHEAMYSENLTARLPEWRRSSSATPIRGHGHSVSTKSAMPPGLSMRMTSSTILCQLRTWRQMEAPSSLTPAMSILQ